MSKLAVSRTHRVLLVIVGVLLTATMVSMVMLWPSGADEGEIAGDVEELEDLVDGEILTVDIIQTDVDELTGLSGEMAILEVELHDGPDAGSVIDLEIPTDGFPEIREGDRVALDRTIDPEGDTQYFITDIQR